MASSGEVSFFIAMPSAVITERMPSSSVEVFDLLHDRSRLKRWDGSGESDADKRSDP
jgi:hypothetical protein